MSSPNHYTKRRSPSSAVAITQPRSNSNSKKGFLCKSVLFALFLLAVPLFPSQAPDFVAETVFTKFWELIHLLFVGIAVAYGLFSRRNVGSSVDLRTRSVDESSLSYVSRIFQVSSVFDDELENSCEFDDVTAQASVVVKERKSESFVAENEVEELSEFGKTNEVQAWNSQYFQGRSKVVVARPAYGLDGHVVHKPLGLPVRSLRSALRDNGAFDDNGALVNGKIEEHFDEVISAPSSPAHWDSRTEMMGMGEDYSSHFQSLSVDETQSANLKSRSSRSSGSSSSSKATFVSHSPSRFSPSHSHSVSDESLNSKIEELVKEKSLEGSSRSSSPSMPPSPSLSQSPKSLDDTRRVVSHSRHYSDGSMLEEDVRNGFEDEFVESKVRGRRTEFLGKKEMRSRSVKLTAESSRGGSSSRRSYPPDSISSPIGSDDSITRQDDRLFNDSNRKGSETNLTKVKKGWSHESLELTEENYGKDKKFHESSSSQVTLFQPINAKASKKAKRSSRKGRETEKDIARNLEEETVDLDKSRRQDLIKELKSSSLRSESQSWKGSSKFSFNGKSVRTIRSDRHGKDGGGSSGDWAETELKERPKSRTQEQEQEQERSKLNDKDDDVEEKEVEQAEVSLEEEEAAWESMSNASHDHNEVDRKAGEFIAKFREQIRLQKLTSGELPRGGTGIVRNSHFR